MVRTNQLPNDEWVESDLEYFTNWYSLPINVCLSVCEILPNSRRMSEYQVRLHSFVWFSKFEIDSLATFIDSNWLISRRFFHTHWHASPVRFSVKCKVTKWKIAKQTEMKTKSKITKTIIIYSKKKTPRTSDHHNQVIII